MARLIALSVLAGLLALVASDLPLLDINDISGAVARNDLDATIYRIPDDIDPSHFEVEVTPYFEDAPDGKENFTFDGIVTITFKVRVMLPCIFGNADKGDFGLHGNFWWWSHTIIKS